MRSPARRPICVSSGAAAYGGAVQTRSSLSDDAAISVVISFVVLAISRRWPAARPQTGAPVELSKTTAAGADSAGGGAMRADAADAAAAHAIAAPSSAPRTRRPLTGRA